MKNTITMTAEEKKAMRAEMDRKKKAAKRKKEEQERQQRLAEEAERARIAGVECHAKRSGAYVRVSEAHRVTFDVSESASP